VIDDEENKINKKHLSSSNADDSSSDSDDNVPLRSKILKKKPRISSTENKIKKSTPTSRRELMARALKKQTQSSDNNVQISTTKEPNISFAPAPAVTVNIPSSRRALMLKALTSKKDQDIQSPPFSLSTPSPQKKLIIVSPLTKKVLSTPTSNSIENKNMFYIESILSHRKTRNRWEFLVKWENFPISENTWEPYSNIKDALPWAYGNFDKIKASLPKKRGRKRKVDHQEFEEDEENSLKIPLLIEGKDISNNSPKSPISPIPSEHSSPIPRSSLSPTPISPMEVDVITVTFPTIPSNNKIPNGSALSSQLSSQLEFVGKN